MINLNNAPRRLCAAAAMCLYPLLLQAQPFAGLAYGYAYTLHPGASAMKDQGYEIEQTGTPASIEAGWTFTLPVEGFTVRLSPGIRAGMQDVETMTPSDDDPSGTEFSFSTKPVRAFVRAAAGYFFLDASAGVHASSVTYKTNTGDFSGEYLDFSAGFGTGAELILLDRIAIRSGPQCDYFYLGDNGIGKSLHMVSIGFFAGATVAF